MSSPREHSSFPTESVFAWLNHESVSYGIRADLVHCMTKNEDRMENLYDLYAVRADADTLKEATFETGQIIMQLQKLMENENHIRANLYRIWGLQRRSSPPTRPPQVIPPETVDP